MKYEVIIIGSEISALSLAALLAKDNHGVVIIEKEKQTGGNFSCIEQESFVINNSLHFTKFCRSSKIFEILKLLGEKPKFIKTGYPLLLFENKFYPISINPFSIVRNRFLTKTGKLQFFKTIFPLLFLSPKKFLEVSLLDALGTKLTDHSLLEYLQMISLLAFNCTKLNKISSGEFMGFIRKFINSSMCYPIGGWREIISTLSYYISKSGKILTNTKVDNIVFENNSAIGVNTSLGFIEGKVIVSSISLCNLKHILNESYISQKLKTFIDKLDEPTGIIYNICLNKKVSNMKNIFLLLEPPTIGFFNSNSDPSLAPPGNQLATFLTLIEKENLNDENLLIREKERLKNTLNIVFKGLSDSIIYERENMLSGIDSFMPQIGFSDTEIQTPDYLNIPNLLLIGPQIGGKGIGEETSLNSSLIAYNKIKNYL